MIRRLLKAALPGLLLLYPSLPAFAATCSCAGVPVLIYLDTSAIEKGDFFASYTADDHQINDLVSGSDDVPDETGRDRASFSQVLSASYAFTDHWSVSALASYVKHERKIGSSSFGEVSASGIGDSVLLVRYSPFYISPFSRHELSLGLGLRIPTGENDIVDVFLLSEDMQPGTGAVGKIGWASYSYAFNQAATLQAFTSINYTHNEENDRHYRFGHEFNFSVGLSQSLGSRFGYSAALRYRSTEPDRRSGFELPNSGGKWIDFIPAIRYAVTDRFGIALSGRIPVARDLNGVLQFTTSYSYAVTVSYGF